MGNFMRVGPDLDAAMNAPEGPVEPMSDDEVNAALSDNGQEGTRVTRVQFDGNGNTVKADNTGHVRVNEEAPRSNMQQTKITALQRQYDSLSQEIADGLESGDMAEGDAKFNSINAKRMKLEEQAQYLAGTMRKSAAADAVQQAEENDRVVRELQEQIAAQEAAREEKRLRELAKRYRLP